MESNQSFCIALGQQEFIVVIFNDELPELQDCAMDAGDALWEEAKIKLILPAL